MKIHLPLLLLTAALSACTSPVTLKTITLKPVNMAIGTSGAQGSSGYCFSSGDIPPVAFSPGSGQVMVGFDDYFAPGTEPFPCDDIRWANFRAGVLFDLSPFDNLAIATLKFDTASSVERDPSGTRGTSPGKSFATTLGVGTAPFSSQMPDTNEAVLPAGPAISIVVGGQVHDWVANGVANHGFVIWGPRDHINVSNPPKNNNAALSFFQNFALEVVYNPALNPRAPQ